MRLGVEREKDSNFGVPSSCESGLNSKLVLKLMLSIGFLYSAGERIWCRFREKNLKSSKLLKFTNHR